jgi:prolipoprotein diacylglyceryltransferase
LAVGLIIAGKRWASGATFAIYIAGYSLGRFFIEGLRIDSSPEIAGLRLNQWTSIAILLLGLFLFYRKQREGNLRISKEK